MMASNELQRRLTLLDALMIVSGSMIGSGIFIVSADITRRVGSPFGLLAVWVVSGLMTLAGALAYGELAALMPEAGGQYVFLREAYGGAVAFSFGWTLLLVIQTGTIAAVAVAFARFAGVLWPLLGSQIFFGVCGMGLSGERLGAIVVIALLTAVNLRGLSLGALVQNLFTGAKCLSLLLIIVVGCLAAPNVAALRANFGSAVNFFGAQRIAPGTIAVFGAAMVGALFSSDAWASVTFAASEVRNPGRNLPRALAIGAGVVIALYVLTNLSYLCELPALGAYPGLPMSIAGAESDRVATAALQMVWGHYGEVLIAILVMVSTFGCANGLILTGARVIYAMAHDGVFASAAGTLNQAAAPATALVLQGTWSALLTLSGTYTELLDYVIFAQLLFYVLTVGAVFILRRKKPDAPRSYSAWGYPVVPVGYIVLASALMLDLLWMRPRYSWPGLLIALSAVPVYVIVAHRNAVQRAAINDL
jgi:APA family basic amino acid/polyamine antiporter